MQSTLHCHLRPPVGFPYVSFRMNLFHCCCLINISLSFVYSSFETKFQQVRQLSGLAYIPTCRSPSPHIVYNTGCHRASGGLFLTLHTPSAAVKPVCRTWLTTDHPTDYRFFTFWPMGDNPWAKVHQKGRWPGSLLDLPSYKISSPYHNPRPRYPLPKILRTKKQRKKHTVTDISPACLLACGDKKLQPHSRVEWTKYWTDTGCFINISVFNEWCIC